MKTQISEIIAVGLTRGDFEDFPVWGFLSILPRSSGNRGTQKLMTRSLFWGSSVHSALLCVAACIVDAQRSRVVTEKRVVWSKTDGFESWLIRLLTE